MSDESKAAMDLSSVPRIEACQKYLESEHGKQAATRGSDFGAGWDDAIAYGQEPTKCGHPGPCRGLALDGNSCGWCADIQDMGVLSDHLSVIYDYMSGGRISKPMTLPEEVIEVHEELDTEEHREELSEEISEAIAQAKRAALSDAAGCLAVAIEEAAKDGDKLEAVSRLHDKCESVLRGDNPGQALLDRLAALEEFYAAWLELPSLIPGVNEPRLSRFDAAIEALAAGPKE